MSIKDITNDNLKALGLVIRLNRIEQNMSLRALAAEIPMSYGQLSKIETGTEKPSIQTIEDIFKALMINFNSSTDVVREINDKFLELYKCIVDVDYTAGDKIMSSLEDDEDRYKYSPAYLYYHLIRYVYYVSRHNNIDDKLTNSLESKLDKFENIMNQTQKKIFYHYKGVRALLNFNFKNGKKYLLKALDYPSLSMTDSMLYYHLALMYNKLNDPLLALEYSVKAKKKFESENIFKRSLYCQNNMAKQYAMLNKFDKALEYYKKIKYVAKKYNFRNVIIEANDNIVWVMIKQKKYDEVNKYVLESIEYGNTNYLKLYFYNGWAFYKLDQLEKAKEWLQKGIDNKNKSSDISGIKLLNYLDSVLKNKRKVEVLSDAIESIEKIKDNQAYIFCINEIVKLLKQDKRYELAIYYYDKLLKISYLL